MSYIPYESPATARAWARARAKAAAAREAKAQAAELYDAVSLCLDRLLPLLDPANRAQYTARKVITARAKADPEFASRLLAFYFAEFDYLLGQDSELDRLLSNTQP